MKKTIVIIIVVVLAAFAAAFLCIDKSQKDSAFPPKGEALRLATYNVGVFHKSGEDMTSEIAAMMRELDADVLSLNELDSCNTRNDCFQLADFCSQMGEWRYRFSKTIDFRDGSYGIGVAFRPSLDSLYSLTYVLPKGDGPEDRVASVVAFPSFVFISTHLDHTSAAARSLQIRSITDFVSEHFASSSQPVFLCGDFNAKLSSEEMQSMLQDWTLLSPTDEMTASIPTSSLGTYPADAPNRIIDYIFVFKNGASCRVTGGGICTHFDSADVTVTSDHLPVYVDVVI